MQLLDDNSMLLGAGLMNHRLLTHFSPPWVQYVGGVAIFGGVCAAIWGHVRAGESTLHQLVFAGMMLSSAFRSGYLIEKRMGDERLRLQMRWAGIIATGKLISGSLGKFDLKEFRHFSNVCNTELEI